MDVHLLQALTWSLVGRISWKWYSVCPAIERGAGVGVTDVGARLQGALVLDQVGQAPSFGDRAHYGSAAAIAEARQRGAG